MNRTSASGLSGSQDGARKLQRAFEHLGSVETLTQRWLKGARLRHAPPDETSGFRTVYFVAGATPQDLELLIGECLHNARSSLDNLAYALAERHAGSGFTERMRKRSEFPIFGESAPAAEQLDARIGGVHPDARRIIEALQPSFSADYQREPLWHLHDLDRINKHRLIHVALAAMSSAAIPGFGGELHVEELNFIGAPPVPGGVEVPFASYKATLHVPGRAPEPLLPLSFEGMAVFGPGPCESKPLTEVLRRILEHLRDRIFEPLEPFLQQAPPDA